MRRQQLYDRSFYAHQRQRASRSASVIVPLILAELPVRSVCDVGCGVGAWLAAFAERGVADLLGFDGAYVHTGDLLIPPDHFVAHDLEQPLECERRFDLVLSLEVAEHLPERCARRFVDSLTRLGPRVLFSAAIPFQGGWGHVNEQWPSYWARLFAERDFAVVDFLRPRIWRNPRVNTWYKQNTLLYVRRDELAELPGERFPRTAIDALDQVHPDHYLKYVSGELTSYRTLLRRLPQRLGRRLGWGRAAGGRAPL